MKKHFLSCLLTMVTLSLFIVAAISGCSTGPVTYEDDVNALAIVDPTGNEPVIRSVIFEFDDKVDPASVGKDTFKVLAGSNLQKIVDAYVSDANGIKAEVADNYITIELDNSTGVSMMRTDASGMSAWKEKYIVKLGLEEGKTVKIGGIEYDAISESIDVIDSWICKETDAYVKDVCTYTEENKTIKLNRTLYSPARDAVKNPLIVWLHGGGEGGTDINIPLMKYNTVALSGEAIQSYFKTAGSAGAYVSVVQCPTMWLDRDGTGNDGELFTGNDQNSYYTEALHAAIADVISENPDIDAQRVYIAGCSNGGYMTLKLALDYQGEYAAFVLICEAFLDGNLTNAHIKKLADEAIWFIHSDDDTTIDPKKYTLPTYYRLLNAGAENVYFSYLHGYLHGVWGAFMDDASDTVLDNELARADFENLTIEPNGGLQSTEYYASSANCTIEKSLFGWMAEQRLH